MRIVEVDTTGPLLDAVYRDVLVPSFVPDELPPYETLRDLVDRDEALVAAVLDAAKRPMAALVGRWSPAARVWLLSQLAVVRGARGGGVGGQLLDRALYRWREDDRPCAVLAEVEHPAAHRVSTAYGDPAARLRFYHRHGGAALDVPYFQPALSPATGRCYGLLLVALHVDPALAGAVPGTMGAEPLGLFVADYFARSEGGVPDDPAAMALFGAIDRPDGVPTVALTDVSRLPLSMPVGR